jgi:hypothetical protein
LGPSQGEFCNVAENFIRSYQEALKTGANEAGLSQLRYNRRQSLSSIMGMGQVTRWTGVVKAISTDSDGTGRLAVQLSCGTDIASDVEIRSEPGIAQGTVLYSTLISLKSGQAVIIDGTFDIGNGVDYIRERSITELGSMTNPEFNFAFESISPATEQ